MLGSMTKLAKMFHSSMSEKYNQILLHNVESVVPNSSSITLNNVSSEHKGWFAFAEIETKYFISRFLKDDSICIDVGANIGMYSLLFLQLSPSSKVIAFEPTSNFNFLQENIPGKFKVRFQSFQVALGDKDGVVEAEIWESFGHKKVKDYFRFSKLDTFLEKHPVDKIDLIKIDTDGFEIQILLGAINTIARYVPLIIIESDSEIGSGQSRKKIGEILTNLGYKKLGTLDSNNDIYSHKGKRKTKEIKKLIRRGILVQKSFLGVLTPSFPQIASKVHPQRLLFRSTINSRVFFQNLFFTNGIPWSYTAESSTIQDGAQFIQVSGMVLGADSSLICISDNIATLFSIPLPSGLYSKVLIPLKNTRDATNIRVVIRSGGRKGKALFLGLKIVSVL
jgi:FkbM family methyltransferase